MLGVVIFVMALVHFLTTAEGSMIFATMACGIIV
jgi:hypothetical protein